MSSPRIVAGATAALAVLAGSSPAVAQSNPEPITPDGPPDFGKCTEPRPIAGTVRYALGLQARDTNAQFYGAAAFTERVLLPSMPQ